MTPKVCGRSRRILLCLGAGNALVLAICGGSPAASADALSEAKARFEAQVAPLPALRFGDGPSQRRVLLEGLGGPAQLPSSSDLEKVLPLLTRAPRTWSDEDVRTAESFLAENTALVTAADRAAGRNQAGVEGRAPWESLPTDLMTRASTQAKVLRLRIGVGVARGSWASVEISVAALAAEVQTLRSEPGSLFVLCQLPA
jgi:hypothetical protein